MTLLLAGHSFNSIGYCTWAKTDGSVCPVKRSDLYGIDMSYVGEPNMAHVGNLNANEVRAIMTRNELDARFCHEATNHKQSASVAVDSDWVEF